MEVTKHNFQESLDEFSTAIAKADFLAIDGEFTGLGVAGCNILPFDTPAERYHKLRQGAMDFLLVQFGVCAFHYDSEINKYVTRAFNFYVFPHPFSNQAPDNRFLCQTSSIDFLISQGFDFNKLFRDGISYLTPDDEQKLREKLQQKHQLQSLQMTSPAFTTPTGDRSKGPIVILDEHKEFISEICSQIEVFLKTDDESMHLPPCNAYLRKIIYQTVSLRFQSCVHLETKTDATDVKTRYIVVSQVKSEAEFRNREERKRELETQELNDAVGFSKVIAVISESGKLIIGHNMLLDLMHVINRFRSPLPEDYEEFKSLVTCIFPKILDTKSMASTHPFKELIFGTGLSNLQKLLQEKPFTKPDVVSAKDFPSYTTESERLHEAGYDAFITGLCFIGMANHLGSYQDPAQTVVPATSSLIEPFINKLYLMKIYDIPYMNLSAPDLVPTREHVFHIDFPREWKTSDISHLFSPFGNVQIAWIDDTSAFVALHKKDQAVFVMNQLAANDHYHIMPYATYLKKKQIANFSATPQSLRRKMPASDVDIRSKRKRSLEGSSPYASSTTITSIPEEDEAVASDASIEKSRENKQNQNSATCDSTEDLGVPIKRARKSEKDKVGKMFEEPKW